jgi:hypothetical protein
MEIEERLLLIEGRLTLLEDENKRLNNRLNLQEDEIERIQKDLNVVGENCKIETPCFVAFENSLTKKLIKERDEAGNSR